MYSSAVPLACRSCCNWARASPSMSEAANAPVSFLRNSTNVPKSVVAAENISARSASFQALAVPSVMKESIKMIRFLSVSYAFSLRVR